MIFRSFEELFQHIRASAVRRRVAVASCEEAHTLEAVCKAADEGVAEPVLIGEKALLERALAIMGRDIGSYEFHEAGDFAAMAETAVRLVREGGAQFIMKGRLETSDLLKAVVNKETGLGTGRMMSHIAINSLPTYHKLLITTDGGMLLNPTLAQKKDIIINAVGALRAIGYTMPKVCVLAAAEKVNPKLVDSVDAAALKEMNEQGEIAGCIVEGPISLDLALVGERCAAKGYRSPCAGDADILVVPNITAGNILGKAIVELAGGRMAGLIVGAKCPIVVTSRGSSAEEKYNSLCIAAAMAG